MLRIVLLVFLMSVASGCSKKELSEEERIRLTELKAEIDQTESSIKAAEVEDGRYAGGLVKALIAVRLEILRTNKSLLEQRVYALESNAPITVTVYASTPSETDAAAIKSEIASVEASLKEARQEASRYSGGLVLATKMAAIATQEQTLAMLRQRFLIAKYGLAFPPSITARNALPEGAKQTEVSVASTQNKAPAASGPLGLKQGLTRDEIESMVGSTLTLIEGAANVYLADSAPKPHPAFENYALVIGDVSGLCQVRGLGKDIKTSRHGIQLKTAFTDLEATLTEMYGPAEKMDKLLPGSIWKDPEDWMMGMVQEERFLFARWPQKEGGKLKGEPEGIESVALVARAKSSDTGYLILEYSFTNNKQCSEEESGRQKSAL